MATNRQKVSRARNFTKRSIMGIYSLVFNLKRSNLLYPWDREIFRKLEVELFLIIKNWDKSFVKDRSDKTIDALAKEL